MLYAGSKGLLDKLNELLIDLFLKKSTVIMDLTSFDWNFLEKHLINVIRDYSNEAETYV